MSEKILVALSGKIESVVAAWLLKKQGKQLRGVYFDLIEKNSTKEAIVLLERKLGISIQVVDCKAAFEMVLRAELFTAIPYGKKINPKELFHQRILFPKIFELKKQFQFQKISTGHRVQLRNDANSGIMKVYRYEDANLDEAPLLVGIGQSELKDLEFPLGSIPSTMIQKIADELGVANESATLDLNWGEFFTHVRDDVVAKNLVVGDRVSEYLSIEGMRLGACPDYTRLTLGDSVELNTVLDLDARRRRIILGSLSAWIISELHFEEVSWFTREDLGVDALTCSMIWANHPEPVTVKLIQFEGNRAKAHFSSPLIGKDSNIFHGQTVLWISGQEVLGGGRVMRKPAAANRE
jgi:tRNA-specific 2-thiouridylase